MATNTVHTTNLQMAVSQFKFQCSAVRVGERQNIFYLQSFPSQSQWDASPGQMDRIFVDQQVQSRI